ncbi:Bug family tripartite tricarboxylate transporter substrate binding protein [Enterovirga rhinocerotis]|uniref:Tripartite-type tricarboxylate transporter receptor subunit TctC n=1 Tax=Enterovirga rhinocerotis TaxID=1339210 RepID=A0A4R7BW60_9HYPH|nr:tripartite tricarboxylate transporter substrate binding protein [Enterovirga rhinocerotis]TDR88186.1 tripartite-type tricarboxylate transporter receptor subunit TctC [Enterovirga rhinocerotis]
MSAAALFRIAVATLAFAGVSTAHANDAWPGRQPIMMLLPAGPGGSSDALARLLAEQFGTRLKQSVVVQNRPGAAGNIGMAQAARARPDGYSIALSWTGPMATNLALYRDVGFDPKRDFAPIGMIGCTPNVLAVSQASPIGSLSGFIDHARSRAGSTFYGSAGIGSSWHLAGEMVNRKASNGLVHVPFTQPGQALTEMLGGRLDAIFPVLPMTVPHVRAGTIRALAVFSKARSTVLPEVPTTAELGYPDLVSDTCFALLAPAGTPADIIGRLNSTLAEIVEMPSMKERMRDLGLTVTTGAPSLLTDYLSEEIPRQAALVAASGAKAD